MGNIATELFCFWLPLRACSGLGVESVHCCVFGLFSNEHNILCGISASISLKTLQAAKYSRPTVFTTVHIYSIYAVWDGPWFARAQCHKQSNYSPLSTKASILSLKGCRCSSGDSEQTLCTSFSHSEEEMKMCLFVYHKASQSAVMDSNIV